MLSATHINPYYLCSHCLSNSCYLLLSALRISYQVVNHSSVTTKCLYSWSLYYQLLLSAITVLLPLILLLERVVATCYYTSSYYYQLLLTATRNRYSYCISYSLMYYLLLSICNFGYYFHLLLSVIIITYSYQLLASTIPIRYFYQLLLIFILWFIALY